MIPTKKELLEEIEQKEADRLMALNTLELRQEYAEWFSGAFEGNIQILDREHLINDLIEDFTEYRKDDSIEELQEKLNTY